MSSMLTMKKFGIFLTGLILTHTATTPAVSAEQDALKVLSELHDSDPFSRDMESDGADRIRLADRLRMLTQKVAASSCALTSRVAIEESYAELEEATHEIDVILDALRNGNEALHILGPEKSRRTLENLEALSQEWRATHGAVDSVLANGQDVESAHVIDDHNLELLRLAETLTSDIMGKYTHPYELTQADALLLEIAGRQRMFTQKMAKDACEIWTGYHAEDGRKDLEQTMVIFDNSLNALRFGMPAAGIVPAPTPAIEEDLDALLTTWSVIRGNLDLLLAGEPLSPEQKAEVFHDFNVELAKLDQVITAYKNYAERHH